MVPKSVRVHSSRKGVAKVRAIVIDRVPTDPSKRMKRLESSWPDPGTISSNEVRIATRFSGMTNGTERNDLLGGNYAVPDSELPSLGVAYQNVGLVEAVGPQVHDLQVGDTVFSGSPHVEYANVEADGLVVRLPSSVKPEEAALFGMSSVALHAISAASIQIGQSVLVVGAGFIGQMMTQLAALAGALVTIADIDPRRLELAENIGAADRIVDASADEFARIESETFGVIIDIAGVKGMEDRLIDLLSHRGRILFIAGRQRVDYLFNRAQVRELTIQQTTHFQRQELHAICRLASSGLISIAPLVSGVHDVAEAEEIYITLRDTPNAMLGTVFRW